MELHLCDSIFRPDLESFMDRAESEEERCQYQQCNHKSHGLSNYCTHHGGTNDNSLKQSKAANVYKLQIFQARVDQFATDPNIKNLRNEIAILRLLIETRINKCNDEYDLMLQSAAIATLVTQANSLVTSCHRIETLTGHLLDKQSLAEFAIQVVEIITNEVEPEQADKIADMIIKAMPNEDE